MRIATWNVNSLKARLEKLEWWIARAEPDVVLLQETKVSDDNVPREALEKLGYAVCHHGEKSGRNGVAIASRVGLADVVTNFGQPLAVARTEAPDDEPFAEARMIAATCGDVRVVSIYAPNGRKLGSPFYDAKLVWFDRLAAWLAREHSPSDALLIGGDYNVAPADADVWDPAACHGGTHVSPKERAAFERLIAWGLVDAYRLRHTEKERYSWWDYRAGLFHKNYGMRIDHLLVTARLGERVVWSEIDREARKGKPVPSDHAPVLLDLDAPGKALDPGWSSADQRIGERRAKARK
ncbi:MAG: exodeoxyribonuclease III [Deltaproteobacteria bacterium]|nr:exodeoxyribonuclease III [Deltaproteobacteria bacterium]